MRSWELLVHLTPFRESEAINTVYLREAKRPLPWPGIRRLIARSVTQLLVVMSILTALVAFRAPLPLASRLLTAGFLLICMIFASLVMWVAPLGLLLGPLIVREREQHTWDTLRLTPLSTEWIILGKARGALWRLRIALFGGRAMLIAAAFIVAVLSLSAIPHTASPALGTLSGYGACGLGLIVMATGTGLYLIDRAQQFVLMAVAALSASANVPSMRTAIPAAYAVTFAAWLFDACIPVLVLALRPVQYTSLLGRVVTVALFGPVPAYFSDLPLGGAIAACGVTLLLREAFVAALWHSTITGASRA